MAFASPTRRAGTKSRLRDSTNRGATISRLDSTRTLSARANTTMRTHPEHELDDSTAEWVRRGRQWLKPSDAGREKNVQQQLQWAPLNWHLALTVHVLTDRSSTMARPRTAGSTGRVPGEGGYARNDQEWLKYFRGPNMRKSPVRSRSPSPPPPARTTVRRGASPPRQPRRQRVVDPQEVSDRLYYDKARREQPDPRDTVAADMSCAGQSEESQPTHDGQGCYLMEPCYPYHGDEVHRYINPGVIHRAIFAPA